MSFNEDDPQWPQNYDEIVTFLAIFDSVTDQTPVSVIRTNWAAKREQMRA